MPNIKIIDPAANLPFGYVEDKESGEENYNWTTGELSATRIFKGPWEFRQQFLQEFYLQASGNNNNNLVFAPIAHPALRIPAIKANVVGKLDTDLQTDLNYIKHGIAIIRIDYASQTNNGADENDNGKDFEGMYLEESIESSIELFPVTCKKKEWTGATTSTPVNPGDPVVPDTGASPTSGPHYPSYPGNETLAEQPELTDREITRNVRIIKINYKLSAPYVINPIWNRLSNAVGTVNWITFTVPAGFVALPDRLRYDGISGVTKRELTLNSLVWSIELMFQYYKPGHNTEPTVDFVAPKSNKTYIKHTYIEPLLYYPYPMQGLFRNLTTAEVQAMNDSTLYGGIDEWGGDIDAILNADHIEVQQFN